MTTAIEVTIGLILLYLTLSLVVSAVEEGIASGLGLRARFLERGIGNLLGRTLKGEFYQHGLIKALSKPKLLIRKSKKKKPSYIASSTFSSVALDLIARIPPGGELERLGQESGDEALQTKASFAAQIETLGARAEVENDTVVGSLKEALAVFDRETRSVADLKVRLEQWFDETMERVSGWYKRRTKIVLFVIGLALCFALNADTLTVVKVLWTDDAVRAATVTAAEETAKADSTPELTPEEKADLVEALPLPLGWVDSSSTEEDPREWPDEEGWILKGLGILMTATALTFGAPFWFDLLKKFVNLRSSGARGGPTGESRTSRAPTTPATG